ncbi:PAS domain S-box protein, partial [Desulfosarcina sp.]|uniref:PAS domain S-box protein n=1 Tax=Desulfosarcina sp. TaxID=2027861 RepID=UPI00397115CA
MAGPIEQNDFALGKPFEFQNPAMALTAINSIDSVIQITSDVNVVLDQMMDAVLKIFNSSRAWLFHPCNPKLPSFDVTFESTTSEYPGANALKQQVPITDDMADYCRRALSAMDGPEIDPPEGQPITNDIAIRFNVKSMLFMALRPKSGEPWMFGLHQCDRDRIWTRDEKQLFQMIGKRISVCLDNLLFVGQLKESNEKFRNLSNMLPQIVFETDQKGNLTFVNHNAFSTFGYTYDEFESGLNAIDMIAPVDRNRAAERMLEVMNGVESTLGNEYIATKKDGTEFPVIIYSSQILRNGAPAGIRGIIVDIGDRKLAEEQLRKSEEKYRVIFENVKEGILIAQDNKLKLVNRAAEKILGYTAEMLTSRSFTDFIHPDDRDTFFERYKKTMDGENVETDFAFRIVTESGEERWLEIHSSLLNWENQLSTINFITDITERKNARAALRESEEKFRNLVETINDVIFEMDAQGTVTYLSPSVLKIWGGAMSDVVGKNFLELVHPDDQEQLVKRFIELQQGIEKPMIYRFVDRSGRLLWGRSHSTPIWKDGCFAGARGTLVDLTAQKEAEAEKEKLQQKLLQAQKMESVGRLAGGVAHDFNNMLSVILGYTEIGLEQV